MALIPVVGARNPKFLHSQALDLVGCMHLSPRFSRFNAIKINGFKSNFRIKIQRFETHTCDLDVPRLNPSQ